MPENGSSPVDVRVTGIVRGVDIDRPAKAHASLETLTLEWMSAVPWHLDFEGLDGVTYRGDVLTLYLHGGDLLELRSTNSLQEFATQLSTTLHAMPEVTRGLRSLGSLRGSPGAAHDRWFAPLMSARRAVVGVSDPHQQLEAFDATRLRTEVARAIEEIAAVNAPEGGAHRRALEAALEEEAEPLLAAIAQLGTLAERVRASSVDARLLEWRQWMNQLRTVFAVADERWAHCAVVLREGS